MDPSHEEFTVLARHWDDRWDVFILDPRAGLLGATTAITFGEVEHAARVWLGEHLGRPGPAHDVRLVVVRR